MHFYIVTPSFNQLSFLKRCVASVADQVAPEAQRSEIGDLKSEPRSSDISPLTSGSGSSIRVHHHVQDACSCDGTPEWLAVYAAEVGGQTRSEADAMQRQRSGNTEDRPPNAQRPTPDAYSFSFSSERDSGMYDAIAKGWKRWADVPSDEPVHVLAWLNCDEQYLPGALSNVAAWFRSNPDRELAFGDVLIVDQEGHLQCARQMVSPSAKHIITEQLPLYSAAMFIRANAVQKNALYPDPVWRNIGDVELVLRMMKCKLSFGLLHDYTSAFFETGSNLALDDSAREEYARLRSRAPHWVRMLRWLWVLLHRVKKWKAGCYSPAAVAYSLYVDDGTRRKAFAVHTPEARWLSRLKN